jgi:hypothetical protein
MKKYQFDYIVDVHFHTLNGKLISDNMAHFKEDQEGLETHDITLIHKTYEGTNLNNVFELAKEYQYNHASEDSKQVMNELGIDPKLEIGNSGRVYIFNGGIRRVK